MNWKTWVPLVLAIALGLVAMKIARDLITRTRSSGTAGSGSRIVIVTHDLPAGASLTAEDLSTMNTGAKVSSEAVFADPEQLVGRVLVVSAATGTPVSQSMLAPKGSGDGLQALIPDGMRAITLEINEFSGVAGNLAPGCRVDIVTTVSGDGGDPVSRTIVQDVKVQAIGARHPAEGGDPGASARSVTLIASPKDAEAIELAASTGRPRLVLRGGSDHQTAATPGVTIAALRGNAGIRKATDPFEPARKVELVKESFAPTTQPATAVHMREITIIRAGVQSLVNIDEPVAPRSGGGSQWITSVGTDEISTGTDD